jgi:biopolymer transport protein ExbD
MHTRGPRARRRRQQARLGLNLTSMIDVVFLLLVYFMAATEFKLGEEIFRLDLPRRGAPADPFVLPREPLRIVLVSSGPVCLIRLPGPYAQPENFQELLGFLRENRRAVGVVGGLFEADHPIIIEPTGTTRWEHAMEAFNAAVRARYTNVTFAPPA